MQDIESEKKVFDKIALEGSKVRLSYDEYISIYGSAGLIDLLGPKTKILEIGCGEGVHSNNFSLLGCSVVGIDISELAILKAKENYPTCDFYQMDAMNLDLPKESFDVVIFWATLHHFKIEDISNLLFNASAVLKRGGMLFISEPNVYDIYNKLAFTLARYINKYFSISYFKVTYTENEFPLDPYVIRNSNRVIFDLHKDINYFDYMYKFINIKGYPSPTIFIYFRKILKFIQRFLITKYRYDFFSVILIKT